jgi:hypothetical protein
MLVYEPYTYSQRELVAFSLRRKRKEYELERDQSTRSDESDSINMIDADG